ncbi:hypothetical protein K438DRAFT_378516 [Mycena galopus ATCC 62051]|nr:hypothetical protein K438DRAFT_378516 [Mycena galopus ATCC 62051]
MCWSLRHGYGCHQVHALNCFDRCFSCLIYAFLLSFPCAVYTYSLPSIPLLSLTGLTSAIAMPTLASLGRMTVTLSQAYPCAVLQVLRPQALRFFKHETKSTTYTAATLTIIHLYFDILGAIIPPCRYALHRPYRQPNAPYNDQTTQRPWISLRERILQ